MKKDDFLNLPHVTEFVQWIISKEQSNSFLHQYDTLNPQTHWTCHSIYNAFENYKWKGWNFEATTNRLDDIKSYLQTSLSRGEGSNIHCEAILRWGGVFNNGNRAKLENFNPYNSLEERLIKTKLRLDPDIFDSTDVIDHLYMSSGFSKIYSLLIDNFVIYDSRVGAALGLLVRKYCEELNLPEVPPALIFAWSPARPTNGHVGEIRNPSTEAYVFPRLNNNTARYINNNMRANWLITAVATHENSRFKNNPSPGRCLESALFMIGYKVT